MVYPFSKFQLDVTLPLLHPRQPTAADFHNRNTQRILLHKLIDRCQIIIPQHFMIVCIPDKKKILRRQSTVWHCSLPYNRCQEGVKYAAPSTSQQHAQRRPLSLQCNIKHLVYERIAYALQTDLASVLLIQATSKQASVTYYNVKNSVERILFYLYNKSEPISL